MYQYKYITVVGVNPLERRDNKCRLVELGTQRTAQNCAHLNAFVLLAFGTLV